MAPTLTKVESRLLLTDLLEIDMDQNKYEICTLLMGYPTNEPSLCPRDSQHKHDRKTCPLVVGFTRGLPRPSLGLNSGLTRQIMEN